MCVCIVVFWGGGFQTYDGGRSLYFLHVVLCILLCIPCRFVVVKQKQRTDSFDSTVLDSCRHEQMNTKVDNGHEPQWEMKG